MDALIKLPTINKWTRRRDINYIILEKIYSKFKKKKEFKIISGF